MILPKLSIILFYKPQDLHDFLKLSFQVLCMFLNALNW